MFLLSTPRGKVPFRDMRVSWHHEGNAKRCIRQFSQESSPMSLYHKFSPQTNFAANVNSKQLSAHNGWVHNPQVKKCHPPAAASGLIRIQHLTTDVGIWLMKVYKRLKLLSSRLSSQYGTVGYSITHQQYRRRNPPALLYEVF